MLSYILAGAAAGVIGVLSGQGCLLLTRRDSGQHLKRYSEALQERVMTRVMTAVEHESQERAAAVTRVTEAVKNVSGIADRFATREDVEAIMTRCVSRDDVQDALQQLITRKELELALQGMAQAQAQAQQMGQLARREEVFGNPARPSAMGNQAEMLNVLQSLGDQVAGINRQLGI